MGLKLNLSDGGDITVRHLNILLITLYNLKTLFAAESVKYFEFTLFYA